MPRDPEYSPVGPSGPDLSDPAVLAEQCESAAQGLEQQAQASRPGSAMGGHPFPDYFFTRTAGLLRACAAQAKARIPAPAPVEPPTPPDKPAPAPAKKS